MTPEQQKRELIRALLASNGNSPMEVMRSLPKTEYEDGPYGAWDASAQDNYGGQSNIFMDGKAYPVGPYYGPHGPLPDHLAQILRDTPSNTQEGFEMRVGLQNGTWPLTPESYPEDAWEMGTGNAPMTSPRPQPAPSPLRRRSMMDRAQNAQEDAYARQIDPEQWALYQIEDEGVAFKEMLRDLPPELYREVLRKVAAGVPVPEAFAPDGFTTRR